MCRPKSIKGLMCPQTSRKAGTSRTLRSRSFTAGIGRSARTRGERFSAGISCTVTIVDTLAPFPRSEEHTSELQSHLNLVCRLLLEKKKKTLIYRNARYVFEH